ncbi:hypothetical protein [Leuconostoc mesenteroides]|uniref:hypothetical protein n=1 Tax=Leuconostoc mesenteroides TaxID=1245 RepID=UPI00236246D2|nr:hypothetical protein [Leuconostoc mesenteroides]
MTEPVAYLNKYLDNSTNITRYKPENQRLLSSEPLYTADQLHKRVKMTQAEFETIKIIKQKNNLLSDALNSTAFFGDEKQQSEQQIEFANLFINLDLDNPEETIEIVPDMKWFVRSKRASNFGNYIYLKKIESDDKVTAFNLKSVAEQFDTQEEAEKWTNPLTEAVQLPVEGE